MVKGSHEDMVRLRTENKRLRKMLKEARLNQKTWQQLADNYWKDAKYYRSLWLGYCD